MATVDLQEAKENLSSLLDRVEAGEVITVTRHGRHVALLTAVQPHRPDVRDTIGRLRDLRKGVRLNGLTAQGLRDEGRPWRTLHL